MLAKKKFHLSLSNEYFLFTVIILAMVCFLSAWFCVYSYRLYVEQKNSSLLKLAQVISMELVEIFKENENVLRFFGTKIADQIDPKDLNNIANLLISSVDLNIKSMTKSYISWVNPYGKLIVSGKDGILQNNFPNIRDRKYFISAKEYPWTLQIAAPSKSLFSNSRILPTAMGIQNKRGKFIGYLVLGIRIDHINQYIAKIMQAEKVSYILFNNDGEYILSSESNQYSLEHVTNNTKLVTLMAKNLNNKIMPIQFCFNNVKYSHLIHVPIFPFSILMGFDANAYKQDFLHKVSSRLGEFLFVGIFCLVLLYFFRKKIILPIINLSNLAFAISNGDLNVKIPRQHSLEMFRLAKGLLLVIRSIRRTERYKQQLELANRIAKDSDFAKAEFTKKMHYEFELYLKEILIYSNVIRKHFKNNLVGDNKVIKYSSKIQEIVTMIYNKTGNTLEFKCFSLVDALEQAITINMKNSFVKAVHIITKCQQNIPNIYADELRIKQILISLLHQSIENSPKNSAIYITINSCLENNIIWFEITIEDQTFGLDDNDLREMEEKFNEDEVCVFEFTKMKIQFIEKLVLMHQGNIKIINKLNEGRKVQLLLPLLLPTEQLLKDNVINMADHGELI